LLKKAPAIENEGQHGISTSKVSATVLSAYYCALTVVTSCGLPWLRSGDGGCYLLPEEKRSGVAYVMADHEVHYNPVLDVLS
jgi:hypothetical protein